MDQVDVVVEIAAGSRNKYELDPATNRLRLTRQLPQSVTYPVDYGFIPGTIAGDGDPLDALVLLEEPALPGCILSCRPLGLLRVEDGGVADPKILTVLDELADQGIQDLTDIPERRLEEIEHFFSVYKDLEPGSEVDTNGYAGITEAREEISASRRRYETRGRTSEK